MIAEVTAVGPLDQDIEDELDLRYIEPDPDLFYIMLRPRNWLRDIMLKEVEAVRARRAARDAARAAGLPDP